MPLLPHRPLPCPRSPPTQPPPLRPRPRFRTWERQRRPRLLRRRRPRLPAPAVGLAFPQPVLVRRRRSHCCSSRWRTLSRPRWTWPASSTTQRCARTSVRSSCVGLIVVVYAKKSQVFGWRGNWYGDHERLACVGFMYRLLSSSLSTRQPASLSIALAGATVRYTHDGMQRKRCGEIRRPSVWRGNDSLPLYSLALNGNDNFPTPLRREG